MYVKFQKLLMTGCRDMDKKPRKCPQNGGLPPFVTPQDFFFKTRALSLLYPYGALTSCKNYKKLMNGLWDIKRLTNGRTIGRTTDGQGQLLRTSSGEPGVQNKLNDPKHLWLADLFVSWKMLYYYVMFATLKCIKLKHTKLHKYR